MLDPCPTNELGRNLIAADLETWLLAHNYVYARRLPSGTLIISKRPMAAAMNDFARSLLSTPSPTQRPARARRATVNR